MAVSKSPLKEATRVASHVQPLDAGTWCDSLRRIEGSTLLSVVREPMCYVLNRFKDSDTMNIGDVLKEEMQINEFKLLSKHLYMDEEIRAEGDSWLKRNAREAIPPLLNGAPRTCSLWFGVDNDGTVIGSHLNDPRQLSVKIPMLFPPLAERSCAAYLYKVMPSQPPQGELVVKEYGSDFEQALKTIKDLKGFAWLQIQSSENENKKYNLVSTRERIAHHLGANVSPQSWRPLPKSIRLPDDHQFARYVIRITIEPEVVCIGAYVKSGVELGRDKQGNRLSPFGVWLRMRNSLSLSSNEMLKSKSNVTLCFSPDVSPRYNGFDFRTDSDAPEWNETVESLLFSRSAAKRIVVVGIDFALVMRDFILADVFSHFENTRPTWKIVLLSRIHEENVDKSNSKPLLERLSEAVHVLSSIKKADVEVIDVISTTFFARETFSSTSLENSYVNPLSPKTTIFPCTKFLLGCFPAKKEETVIFSPSF